MSITATVCGLFRVGWLSAAPNKLASELRVMSKSPGMWIQCLNKIAIGPDFKDESSLRIHRSHWMVPGSAVGPCAFSEWMAMDKPAATGEFDAHSKVLLRPPRVYVRRSSRVRWRRDIESVGRGRQFLLRSKQSWQLNLVFSRRSSSCSRGDDYSRLSLQTSL